jgi:hypothetical protein
MKKFLVGFTATAAALLPSVAFGQTVNGVTNNTIDALDALTDIVNAVIPFLLAIAVVVFIYGVIKYVVSSAPDEKAAGRSYIIWGIIGIAVILSIFGLVKLLQNTFGINNTLLGNNDIPRV